MEESRGNDQTHVCRKREVRMARGVLERVANPLGTKSLIQNSLVVSPQKEVKKSHAIKEPFFKRREKEKSLHK